jgi:hypothetical protein
MEQRDKWFQPRFCLLQRYLLQLQQERAIKPKTVGSDSRVVAVVTKEVVVKVEVAVVVAEAMAAVEAVLDVVEEVAKVVVLVIKMERTASLLVQVNQKLGPIMAIKRSSVECVGIGLGVITMHTMLRPAPTSRELIQLSPLHRQWSQLLSSSSSSKVNCHLHWLTITTTIKDNKFALLKELMSTKQQVITCIFNMPACN